jgi:hypothetical protein
MNVKNKSFKLGDKVKVNLTNEEFNKSRLGLRPDEDCIGEIVAVERTEENKHNLIQWKIQLDNFLPHKMIMITTAYYMEKINE